MNVQNLGGFINFWGAKSLLYNYAYVSVTVRIDELLIGLKQRSRTLNITIEVFAYGYNIKYS